MFLEIDSGSLSLFLSESGCPGLEDFQDVVSELYHLPSDNCCFIIVVFM
jgi:hypothetical protein